VMEKREVDILSSRYQSCHGESHISNCQYLLNQEIKETRTRRGILIILVKEVCCLQLKAKLLKSRSC
jgi:hypothetical protein